MSTGELHDLIERLASLFRAEMRSTATEYGLKLAQVEALVYLSRANRYSDTAGGLADYLGVTKGTVSQTLKTLEHRGLVEKVVDEEDGRVVHVRPTAQACDLLGRAHPSAMLEGLAPANRDATVVALRETLAGIQRSRGGRSFGQCRTCQLFEPRRSGGRCGLTGERLSLVDARALCREHQPVELSDS